MSALLAVAGPLAAQQPGPAVAVKPVAISSQIQVARQFLLAVLAGNYPAAYALLAPEVSRNVPLARFQTTAEPLYRQGQRYQPTIDLYKLGFRISADNSTRAFVAFMFRSDTLAPRPHLQLDVTFRDTIARQVLSFGLVPLGEVKK
ncbi:hypothetical protein [Hymenobacter canadensis]|uniref:DUF3887 domain-containing protein n=1 Tax=Hymenobacter canadensis TaxID=2999067 RepID=A0ABY7LPB6_9BACT|nr:hypothetical protein [Hymenobacter canadensis]WBA40545.1 hypothetical protein O3303_11965 [Hymenobacter canadensis]